MIEPLLAWHAAHCDGEWEHHFGFTIETADNPGLIVTLRLRTDLGPDETVEEYRETRPDPLVAGAWVEEVMTDIRIRDGALIGFCVPGREAELIDRLMVRLDNRP